MYSSGFACFWPSWKAGLSSSISAAVSRSRSASCARWSETSRSSASSGAIAAYLTTWPGRVEARPFSTRVASTS